MNDTLLRTWVNLNKWRITVKLPESNHVFWIVIVVSLLVIADTLTSWLLYKNGYEVSKDSSKTMVLVATVLVPILVQRWNAKP